MIKYKVTDKDEIVVAFKKDVSVIFPNKERVGEMTYIRLKDCHVYIDDSIVRLNGDDFEICYDRSQVSSWGFYENV